MPARRYTRPQREAIAAAFAEPHRRASDVVELAAAGKLVHPSGARLGAFATTQSTVRSEARRARLRWQRHAATARVSELPPRVGLERMRCELADALELELRRIEVEQAHGRAVTGEQLRQIARAIRELAWIPGPEERRPPPPGAKLDGVRRGGETRGGLAGRILTAHYSP